jgi:hypothetical protein
MAERGRGGEGGRRPPNRVRVRVFLVAAAVNSGNTAAYRSLGRGGLGPDGDRWSGEAVGAPPRMRVMVGMATGRVG